jgi:hypothetical protein
MVTVRDLARREQMRLARGEVAAELRRILDSAGGS